MLLLLPGQVTSPLTFRGVPESLARSTERVKFLAIEHDKNDLAEASKRTFRSRQLMACSRRVRPKLQGFLITAFLGLVKNKSTSNSYKKFNLTVVHFARQFKLALNL